MIEDTLNRTGLGDIWLLDESLHNTECIKDRLQLRLNDILKQEWLVATCSNRVCTNYTIFKVFPTPYLPPKCKKSNKFVSCVCFLYFSICII